MYKIISIILLITIATITLGQNSDTTMEKSKKNTVKTEVQWQEELTGDQYRVMRQCGTEPAFTGKYYNTKDEGEYQCAACGHKLFSSSTKYDSGSGWPSFYKPMDGTSILEKDDNNFGMVRTEIVCSNCGSHLGHVFNDGPKPTGLRYCVNSISLDFKPVSDSLSNSE